MPVSAWKSPIVDRIHMTVGISKSDLQYGVLIGQLSGMKDIKKDLVPKGKITLFKDQHVTRIGYYPDKKRKIAELTVGASKSGHMYFRMSLYPSKFLPGEFSTFKEHLEILFQIPYKTWFEKARVSYLELAADSLTHERHTVIPFRERINASKVWKSNGLKSTLRLGSTKSKKRFYMYDKAKQLAETGCAGKHKVRTRFEARLRHIGMTASQIATDLPNPFSPIEIADVAKARCLSTDIAWQAFLDDCEVAGSAHTLAQCTKHARKKYMTRLRACSAPWWNPDFLWKGIHSALEVVAP